jgi:L,D-transpeptidase YcbB
MMRNGLRLLALIALLGCVIEEGKGEPKRDTSAGAVARTWSPPAINAVESVPRSTVRQAIDARLAAERPEPLGDDAWRHAATLYTLAGGGPLWFIENGFDHTRTAALLQSLAQSANDAIDLSTYPLGALEKAVTAIDSTKTPSAEQISEADVLLTATYVRLAEDLLTGQIDPKGISQSWHIDPSEEHVDSALTDGLHTEALGDAIARMRPAGDDYAVLQRALTRYHEIVARGGWPSVPRGKPLRPGMTDPANRLDALRARLAAEGFVADSATTGSVYDSTLAGAVAKYQTVHGITPDSVLDDETASALDVPAAHRLGQIAANLERMRWLPRSLGSRKYIVVNVPAFQLHAYEDGKKAFDMKVIVGAEFDGRRTPAFSDSMQSIVFRPYWMVPDDIAKKEIWPKARRDAGYLERNGYQVVRIDGRTRIRQRPGEKNALGLVKFLFPNDFSIYLHDTPNRSLFANDVRAFSHGCIRVERPEELAAWVLGWPIERVREAMHGTRDDRHMTVREKVPVYITYLTVYASDGEIRFGNDLYARDEAVVALIRNAAAPSEATIRAMDALRRLAQR